MTKTSPILAGVLALAVLCSGLLAAPAEAQLVVQITRGSTAAIPVAIVPFADNAGPATDVAAVVAADLERSGRFKVLPRADLLARPSPGEPLLLADWRRLGVDYVAVGRVRPGAGQSVSVEYELYNVTTGERLLGQSLPAGYAVLRTAAHRVADAVYERILGVPGAFASRLAYVAVDGRAPQRRFRLVIADADGDGAVTILQSMQPLMSPAFSPDGRQLAYVSFEGGQPAVWVQQLQSGQRRRVSARGGLNDAPVWSPDSTQLALTLASRDGNVDVWLLRLENGQLARVTEDGAIDTEPAFSPDGRTLYFTSDRGGRAQIYRVPVTGGRPQRVTFEGSYNARPRPSPDGTQLAVVTQEGGAFRIGLVELSSGNRRLLTEGPNDDSPAFAPNGQWLVYAARERGRAVLSTVATDSLARTVLGSREADVRSPTWGRLP
jgi:TolB protein